MGTRIVQVDSFADRPFVGNPAAVCVLPEWPDKAWMQAVARETNLSETAFLVRRGEGFELRWFTPTVEVDLCGHATLASAHVLWEDGHLKPGERAVFSTLSGTLAAERRGDWIELDLPAEPPQPVSAPPAELLEGLGAKAVFVGRNRMDFMAELATEAEVRALRPQMQLFEKLGENGVIVTARASGPPYDFVSRYFAPGFGIPEDPVTGAAHCCLGPYWAPRLGKTEMLACQCSARGGVVRVRVAGARVALGGQAVTVIRGELL
jgi:PhzF family phenazine biosynthesis protein